MKKTIKDAIVTVLQNQNTPLSVKDIYAKIIAEKQYEFGAKNPISVVSSVLRKHSEGGRSGQKYFQRLDSNRYALIK